MLTRRQFIKLGISSVLAVSSLGFEEFASIALANREIPVLLYHQVAHSPSPLAVKPERLAADLQNLRDYGYRTITLRQFQDFMLGRNVELPSKPVLITFDDGYRDNYEQAFPLLAKYSMVATFYVITSMISAPERLTATQIREMAEEGMSFGSHTVSHRRLAELPAEEMQAELSISRAVLEDAVGTAVESIAYPRGSYNESTIKLAHEAGYINGFTVIHGKSSRYSRPFEIKRIPVFGYDRDIFTVMASRG